MSDFPKLPRIKQDDENMEKIHCAARRGQTDLVRRLVSSGVDAGIQNRFGCTALHLACKYGQIGATRELAAKADLNGVWHGQRPFVLAALSGNAEVLGVLVDTARSSGRDVAAFVNESDEYEIFEINGHAKHVQGQTALHWVVTARNIPMTKSLLALGASATSKDKNGETPLMRCIEFGLNEEFELLLHANNTRVETSDRLGRTHLHWAIMRNRIDMAKKILAMGHDVNLEDQNKETPWMLAAQAAMPALLDTMLATADTFALQQAPFHNGTSVLPERLQWLPFANDESARNDVVKILQKKIDSISKGHAPAAAAGKKMPMVVAPSAPVKKS